jgi:hypothetical protein
MHYEIIKHSDVMSLCRYKIMYTEKVGFGSNASVLHLEVPGMPTIPPKILYWSVMLCYLTGICMICHLKRGSIEDH